MTMVDSDGDIYKNFRQITRQRLSHEMLRFTKLDVNQSTWKCYRVVVRHEQDVTFIQKGVCLLQLTYFRTSISSG
ncbi:SNARE-interacting protein KEULE-like [Mercurialis annua]|uniref:SNARE-interacting protein KEULE-like n=1 Tax=Mercurialis annua TaxID=3986 RepID=UPI0024AD9364|nr:SNARE-interacting protein KEULE-like [Mercurialis annua]